MNTCIYCQNNNLLKGLKVQLTKDIGTIGLEYENNETALIPQHKIEPLLADLCKDCGSIHRLYVPHVNRKWIDAK